MLKNRLVLGVFIIQSILSSNLLNLQRVTKTYIEVFIFYRYHCLVLGSL